MTSANPADNADSEKIRPFDVTLGSVFAIAVPATLGYITVPLVGIVDTAVIGQLGDAALLGGMALGAVFIDLMFATLYFLRATTTSLTAQAMGRADHDGLGHVMWRALFIAVIAALFFLLVHIPALGLAITLVGASEAVSAATYDYFTIRIAGAIPALANMVFLGWLLGLGRAGTGLLLQIVLNVINIGLTLLFVLELGWGVKGAALGTVCAETIAAILGFLLFVSIRKSAWKPDLKAVFMWAEYRKLIRLNADIFIRSILLTGSITLFAAYGARFGDTVLAANAILQKFLMLASYFLDGFAVAAEQLIGRSIGARFRKAFDRALWFTGLSGLIMAAVATGLFLLWGPWMIDFMTTSLSVRETAYQFMIWAALTPLVGVLAFHMDGVFIGAGWTKDARNMMVVSVGVFLLSLVIFVPRMGNDGLWMAFLLLFGMRGATLAYLCTKRRNQTFQNL